MSEILLPYSSPFFTKTGTIITATGRPSLDPDAFKFDLFTTDDCSGVALTVRARFEGDGGTVVMNSKEDGKWGLEETTSYFPFKKGKGFILSIETTLQEYNIVVNNEILYSFRLRFPLSSVKRFGISQRATKELASLEIGEISANDQMVTGQIIYLTSRMTHDNLKLQKDGTTVVTGGGTGDKAKFVARRNKTILSGVSLRNMKFPGKYLAIRNDRLLAEAESKFSYFVVMYSDDYYFTCESAEYPHLYMGVNHDGTIGIPSMVGRTTKAHFYNGTIPKSQDVIETPLQAGVE